ncbi:hypothetical protein B0H67DRAFT_584975 [Lasiosphaeris hirsuta]|uniref:Uncharacterized protein n=1 Tax=Lasiosphaeris hirsuta TaxID=260670 RepID=A0AA40A8S1_9PEZI|nr:hypothetical protein B0H67DRAFT_584975 [Lasiosphaeris hirsuta]
MKKRRIRGEESDDEEGEEDRRNSFRNGMVTTGTNDREGGKMDLETSQGVVEQGIAVTDSFTLVEALRTAGLYEQPEDRQPGEHEVG